MSPNSDMVAEQWLNTVPQSLKSDSQDAQRMIWCLNLLRSRSGDIRDPGRRSAVQVVQVA